MRVMDYSVYYRNSYIVIEEVHNSLAFGHPFRKHSDTCFGFIRTPFRSLFGQFCPNSEMQ